MTEKDLIKSLYKCINEMKYITKDIGIIYQQNKYRLSGGTTTEYKRILLELIKIIRSM